MTTHEILVKAKKASKAMALLDTNSKNEAIKNMADSLESHAEDILKANAIDVQNASGKISDVMIDRLSLSKDRIIAMANGMREVASLPDPVGRVLRSNERSDGLKISKVAVPMGLISIIYESRPNVTSDAAVLALKSGNACVLRGGKEAYLSAKAIVDALREGLEKSGLPKEIVSLVEDTTRQSATDLMTADGLVDLLIPRGGAGLINACVKNATVPCIQTGTGICHVYIDKCADLDKALKIVENAKTSRPSVCNAEEVLIVHSEIAKEFLPKLKYALSDARQERGEVAVEFRCDERAYEIIGGTKAEKSDFNTEFLDYILAVKTVDSAEEAIEHIALHSTGHSDAIITEDTAAAKLFTASVDSAAVYVNASTRFTDGGEFGLGCEMGISTQKLHARGPMGLEELTTYKYVIEGNGNIR